MRLPKLRITRPYAYIALGLALGLGYAFLNTQTDVWAKADWAREGSLARTFFAFHSLVDRGIPVIAGALFGLAAHWLYLRSRLAKELRSRLNHVERDQAVWVVAASTLHELKNPLHALGLLVDELEQLPASELPDHVTRIRATMDRALLPLDALRSLTRRDGQRRAQKPIGPTTAEIIDSLKPLARDAGVELRLEGDRAAARAIDPELVRIIVDNLVANALEGEGSAVEVRILQSATHVTLRVSDNGQGLSTSETIFEPLRTNKSNGLGLGLPIARALARTLGGDLVVADVPGFRTSFELVVPQ